MIALLPFASKAVGVATTTKKVLDLFKSFQEVPEEGYFLWKLLDTAAPPFDLCRQLQKRQETVRYVEAAVGLTRFAIKQCEECLAKDETEDERPESSQAWAEWLSHPKQGMTRYTCCL